jgi:Subtilase family
MSTPKRIFQATSVAAALTLNALLFSAFAGGLKNQLFLPIDNGEYRLLVKFNASTGPDLDPDNKLIFRRHAPLAGTAVQKNALSSALAMNFRRVVNFSADDLDTIKGGALHSGTLPGKVDMLKFSGMMYLEAPGADNNRLLRIGRELEALDEVEYCSLVPKEGPPPPCGALDIVPTTPDFTGQQVWTGPNPGTDLQYCWSKGGLGQGITVRDMEDSWGDLRHEDFDTCKLAIVLRAWRSDYDFHGVSVFGEIFAQHNSYGVNGGAPSALGRGYSHNISSNGTSYTGQDRPAAMAKMVADAQRGDVILLESQETGPDGKLCPEDYVQAIWDLTKQAIDSGIVVVGTAGNGSADMDDSAYAPYRARGDNGVIMVGAGSGDVQHNRLSFSSYGAPVHLQGWGENVVTTSCNSAGCSCADLANLPAANPDGHQGYTVGFSGTSSGGGMIAGVAAAFQSYAMLKLGRFLAPREMRSILVSTGIPQGSGSAGHIGPLPNLRAAIHWVDSLQSSGVAGKNIKNEIALPGLYYAKGMLHYSVPGQTAQATFQVTILLYDLKGSLVATLFNGRKGPGGYGIDLHKAKIPSGTLLCAMAVADNRYMAKIVFR